MGVFRKALPLLFMLFLGLVLSVYLAVPGIAGQLVVKVFEDGTGCKVSLKNPKIRFRAFLASIESVSIICPGEEHGVRAEKVLIGSSWSELLKKKVILSPLEVQGVRAESYSMDSSFLKMLHFILKKPKKEEKEVSWIMKKLEPFTSGWKVWVPEVLVFGSEDQEGGSLVFGFEDAWLRAFNVTFSSHDLLDLPDGVVVLEAESSNVFLEGKNILSRELGSLKFTADISDGVFSLRNAVIGYTPEETSAVVTEGNTKGHFELRGSGGILLRQDTLDLHISLRAQDESIVRSFLPEIPDIVKGQLEISALVQGTYDAPVISGSCNATQIKTEPTSSLSGILPQSVSFASKYSTRDAALEISGLHVDTYLSDAALEVSMEALPDISFSAGGKIGDIREKVSGQFISQGSYHTDREELSVTKVSLTPMSLVEFLRVLKPFTGQVVTQLFPVEVLNRNYQIALDGNFDLRTSDMALLKTELELSARASGYQESFLFRASGKDSVLSVESFLRSVQDAPLLQLTLAKDSLKGEYRLDDLELRRIPLFTSVFQQGHHVAGLKGTIGGTIHAPEISGAIDLASRRTGARQNRELPPLKSSVVFSYAASDLTFSGEFMDSSGIASCAPSVRKRENTIYDCKASIDELPLRFFMPQDSGKFELATLTGELSYQGPFDDFLSGSGFVLINEITVPAELSVPALTSAIEARLENRQFVLTPVVIKGSEFPLVIQAEVSREEGWNVTAHGEYLLGGLIQQLRVLESISGILDVDFSLRGALDNPRMSGVLTIKDAEFAFPLGDGIVGGDSIEGSISLRDSSVLIDEIKGTFGDGAFTIRGGMEGLFSSESRSGDFSFSAQEVRLEPASGLSFLANIETDFMISPYEKPLLRGSVLLDDAVYESTLSIETVISTLTSLVLGGFKVRGKTDDPLSDSGVEVDLEIRAPAGLYLDTSVLTAEFLGGVRLTEDLFSPIVSGEILVLDGEFSINQTDFRIISGRAVFDSSRGSLNPTLSLTSEGELRALTGETQRIYLTLGGTLRTPRVSLSSDGYATQRELAQQLGMGGGGGSQMKLVDGQSSRKAGFREVLSPTSELSLTERFVGLTGIDDVRLETVLSVRTGELVPQVVAGRPLPFDLRGVLSSELAGDRTNAARVEYQLNEVLTAFGGWRSQSVLNPGTTSAANFLFGIRFDETFKGFSFFDERIKEER